MDAPLHKSADFVFHQKEPPNGGPRSTDLFKNSLLRNLIFSFALTETFRSLIIQLIG